MSLQEAAFGSTLTPFFSKVLRTDTSLFLPSRAEPRSRRSRCSNGSGIKEQEDVLSLLTSARESKRRATGVMAAFVASASPARNRLLTAEGGERSGSCLPHWLQLMSGSMHRHPGSPHFISQPAHLITPLIHPRRTITTFTRAQASAANCWSTREVSEPAKSLFPLAVTSERGSGADSSDRAGRLKLKVLL